MRGKKQTDTTISITTLLSEQAIKEIKAISVASLFNLTPQNQRVAINTLFFMEQGQTRFERANIITVLSAVRIAEIEDLETLREIRKALKELKAQQ